MVAQQSVTIQRMVLRRMRLRVSVLLVTLLMLASLQVAAEKVTVEFWFGESPEKYIQTMQQIVDRFNADHPGIEVVMSLHSDIQGAKLEQLKVMIAGGVPPDIAYLDGT